MLTDEVKGGLHHPAEPSEPARIRQLALGNGSGGTLRVPERLQPAGGTGDRLSTPRRRAPDGVEYADPASLGVRFCRLC